MQEIKEYFKERKDILKGKIAELNKKPKFAILQVDDNEAANRYVRNKIKDCTDVGIETDLTKLPVVNIEEWVTEKNNDESVDAIMIQFPIEGINEEWLMSLIDPKKDADGFNSTSLVNPATPQGIITYLQRNGYNFENKNALVIGRSNIVGKPMAKLLLDRNCNVTVVHSHTSVANMFAYLNQADLIICATGHKNTLTDAYSTVFRNSKPVIFDVGINFDFEGKLIGDCQRNLPYVTYQSPVPGGVGLLTRLQLLENIYILTQEKELKNYL